MESPKENKDYKIIIILIIMALFGVYFLGQGITGLVISQSCCFGKDCKEENICPVNNMGLVTTVTQIPGYLNKTEIVKGEMNIKNSQNMLIGSFIVIVSVLGLLFLHHRKYFG